MVKYRLLFLLLIFSITLQPNQAQANWHTQAWCATAFSLLVAQDLFVMGALGAPIRRDTHNSTGDAGDASSTDGFGTSNIGMAATVLGALATWEGGSALLKKIGDAEWAKRLGTSLGNCFCGCVESIRDYKKRHNVFVNLPDEGLLPRDLFDLTTGIMRKATRFKHVVSPENELARYIVPYQGTHDLVTFYGPGEVNTIHNADLSLAPLSPRFRANLERIIEAMAGRDAYLTRDLHKKLSRWAQFNTVQLWTKLDVSDAHKQVHILVLGKYDPTTITDFHVGLKVSIIQNVKATTPEEVSTLLNTRAEGDISDLPLASDPFTWLRAAEQNYLGPDFDDMGSLDEEDALNPVELRLIMKNLMARGITLEQLLAEDGQSWRAAAPLRPSDSRLSAALEESLPIPEDEDSSSPLLEDTEGYSASARHTAARRQTTYRQETLESLPHQEDITVATSAGEPQRAKPRASIEMQQQYGHMLSVTKLLFKKRRMACPHMPEERNARHSESLLSHGSGSSSMGSGHSHNRPPENPGGTETSPTGPPPHVSLRMPRPPTPEEDDDGSFV